MSHPTNHAAGPDRDPDLEPGLPASRPQPLLEIARRWATWRAAVTAVITGLLTAGLLSRDQGDAAVNALGALDVLLAAVIGITAAVMQIIGAFRVAHDGRKVVTPTADPRNDRGERLVPARRAA